VALAIVGGVLAGKPGNGGESWVRASWLLGLARLGLQTHLVEVLDERALGPNGPECSLAGDGPERQLAEDGQERSPAGECQGREFARSAAGAQLAAAVEELSLHGRVSVLDRHGRSLYGRSLEELEEMMGQADVLFDLSGHLGSAPLSTPPRKRVYVDLDPGFTQAWHVDPTLAFTVSGYDRYVTVGVNVGKASWAIPSGGVRWLGTLPPVLLERWASEPLVSEPFRFTTVATWRSPFGPIALGERELGLKHHEFRRLIELPQCVGEAEFELALDIDPADARDLEELRSHGWSVVASREVASTPRAFGEYVRGSCAELSAAQPAYVETGSGWFSDRTAAYLAAGRPALVQETGAGKRLGAGEGFVTFSSPREAAEGAARIAADPLAHGEAARRFAQEHLDSDNVLGRLLEELDVAC
jgi:hypothetical protein